MLEVGAALFLAIPLVLLDDVLEGVSQRQEQTEASLQTVKRDVHEARTQIEELGQATAERIAAARNADSGAVRALRDDVSELNAWRLLRRAQDLGGLDPRGVRVRLPATSLRVRFTAERASGADASDGVVLLAIEEKDGERLAGPETWSPDEPADEALSMLASALQSAGKYPGDESFDAAAVFTTLADTVERVVAVRTGARPGAHVAPAIELRGDWAITVEGLSHMEDDSRRVPTRILLSDRARARALLLGDAPSDSIFEDAFATAVDYHSGEDRRAARRRLHDSD